MMAQEADQDRQFGTMAEKLADYETLLRDLSSRVSEKDADMIRKSLEKVGSGNGNSSLIC